MRTSKYSVICVALIAATHMAAQGPARGGRGGPARGPRPSAYPERPPADPEALARGRALYGVHCNFCHGSDARGGEGGPNLLRSELVMNDRGGELIATVVQNGRPDQGMPKIDLSSAQVSDVSAYIHSFRVGGYDISRMLPPSILVGDAMAGEAYFKATCASCHSVTGDLKGLGAKIGDPKTLQNRFLMPGGRGGPSNVSPTTVTVTPASGPKVDGALVRVDDFIVTLTLADGGQRTFRRDGDSPKVDIHDPLQPHKELLKKYTDKDIHNLTSFLVTLK